MTAPTADHSQLRAKWVEWIRKIEHQLYAAHLHQELWRTVRTEIIERSPHANGIWLWSYGQMYAAATAVTIRRIAEEDEDTASLGSLIDAMLRNPDVITLQWHMDNAKVQRGDEFDDQLYMRVAGHFFGVDGRVPRNDLEQDSERLRASAAQVKWFVDTRIAHIDRSVEEELQLTFDAIATALADVSDVASRYVAIVTGPAIGAWTPAIPHDWREPLREFGT